IYLTSLPTRRSSDLKEYAYSISKMIPYHERGEEDANGWSAACEILKQSRDERKPIELFIWKYQAPLFEELEVVKYLQKMKTEDRSEEHTSELQSREN